MIAPVEIYVEGDDVVIEHADIRRDRDARMFFGTVLGGDLTDQGWRCPRRKNTLASLVVRVNSFLEVRGWKINRLGLADEAIERDLERKRSFQRAREAASAFRSGLASLEIETVKGQLRSFGWNEKARTLFEHQERGLIHGLSAVNAANFSVPGSGKTATTLAIAATYLSVDAVDSVVVVGPLSCFAPWEREVAAALGGRLKPRRIRGNVYKRSLIYQSLGRRELILMSFATAAADRSSLAAFFRSQSVMLVVDESHRVKKFRGGIWAPALIELAKYARVRIILSGTPMPQDGRDLYSQLRILWPDGELTGPQDSFAARVDRSFGAVLRDVQPFISRTPKSALGLQDYKVLRHEVPVSGTQAEIYELIESSFRKRVSDAEVWQDKLDALRRGRPIRLLQAATNPDLLNRADKYYKISRVDSASPTLMQRLSMYRDHEIAAKCSKGIDLLAKIAEDGSKAVCWSNFIGNLDQFAAMVRSLLNIPCFQIDGRVPTGDDVVDDSAGKDRINPDDSDTRERIIDRFLSSQGPAVLVANPASCSESISLHASCHNAIYLDRTYDCALYLQSIDRIHRLGLTPGVEVRVHILLATVRGRPTIDHLVDASLLRKEAVMRELLEGAELRPFQQSPDFVEDAEGNNEDLGELLRFLLGEEQS